MWRERFIAEELGDPAAGIAVSPDASDMLARTHYLAGEIDDALRGLDFAFLPFSSDVYEFTASGSLLDCIANLVPVIATRSTLLERLTRDYGPIGHVCATTEEANALLADPARLADAKAIRGFRAALARVRADRLPEGLAKLLQRDLAPS